MARVVLIHAEDGNGNDHWWSNIPYEFDNGGTRYEAEPILSSNVEISRGIVSASDQVASSNITNLTIVNTSHSVTTGDSIARWIGQLINIYIGDDADPINLFTYINTYINRGIVRADTHEITFHVAPNTGFSQKYMQTNYLSGVGEGADDRPIPLTFGKCYGVAPVVISSSYTEFAFWNRRTVSYRLHDGAGVGGIYNIRSNGFRILNTSDGYSLVKVIQMGFYASASSISLSTGIMTLSQDMYDVDNYPIIIVNYDGANGSPIPPYPHDYTFSGGCKTRVLIWTALTGTTGSIVMLKKSGTTPVNNETFAPDSGTYKTGVVNGTPTINNDYFDNSDFFSGQITVEVDGASKSTYPATVENVCREIIERVFTGGEFDTSNIEDFGDDLDYEIGLHIDENMTVAEAFKRMFPAGVIIGFNDYGASKISLYALKDPGSVADHVIFEQDILAWELIKTEPPVERVTVSGKPNYHPISTGFSGSDQNPPLSPGETRVHAIDYRVVKAYYSADANYPENKEGAYTTTITDPTDVLTEAQRLRALFVARRTYRITVNSEQPKYQFNHVVKITADIHSTDPVGTFYRVLHSKDNLSTATTEIIIWL